MMIRGAKIVLLAGVALFYTLVVFNNITDFDSNYELVRHVLTMDTTFPGNHGLWRALHRPGFHLAFYLGIIGWEMVTMVMLWWGGANLIAALRLRPAAFEAAKRVPVAALTLALVMWLVAFISIGGEWFLMWQSRQWNGQEVAFRNFTIISIVMLFLTRPETEIQP